jgi:hypothetical protein
MKLLYKRPSPLEFARIVEPSETLHKQTATKLHNRWNPYWEEMWDGLIRRIQEHKVARRAFKIYIYRGRITLTDLRIELMAVSKTSAFSFMCDAMVPPLGPTRCTRRKVLVREDDQIYPVPTPKPSFKLKTLSEGDPGWF